MLHQLKKKKNGIEYRYVFEPESDKPKVPNPITTFNQAFHNYQDILNEIKKVGFETPSPIQSQAWPILSSGKDMIGIAQTGSRGINAGIPAESRPRPRPLPIPPLVGIRGVVVAVGVPLSLLPLL